MTANRVVRGRQVPDPWGVADDSAASPEAARPPRDPRADADELVPNVARMYDFYLGGKDNYAADRDAAAEILRLAPFTPALARQNRRFLARAVRHLARSGVDQFIDIGAGLPTQGNVHEIVHAVDPRARVVYVDNDPVVVAHGRALLAGGSRTVVVEGDLRRPADLLADPELTGLIDLRRPVALLLVSVLHCLDAADRPYDAVAALRAALAPGSHLVISHITGDDELIVRSTKIYDRASTGMTHRDPTGIRAFFGDFDLLDPGLVRLGQWRPDADTPTLFQAGDDYYLCGIGRKDG
jgi:SAM-dependent methyltransferase